MILLQKYCNTTSVFNISWTELIRSKNDISSKDIQSRLTSEVYSSKLPESCVCAVVVVFCEDPFDVCADREKL